MDYPSASETSTGIEVNQFESSSAASHHVASEICDLVRQRQDENRTCVLGLATGSTPTSIYKEIIQAHRNDGLSLANVIAFNLDEYYPMHPDQPQSYVRFMNEHLYQHVDVDPVNVHIPCGTTRLSRVQQTCDEYEQLIVDAGGIDLQLLGIGRTGHMGFNEPGSPVESRTRLVTLSEVTRQDASRDFGGIDNVPKQAISMGVATILEARRVRMMAFGDHKAAIVKRTLTGDVSSEVPASFLQRHSQVRFILDSTAGSLL